ncbi:polysaccharide deacetylase family protein [Pseudarthrobacter cellobiosi]|uniref:polysaccharide deacetylase family protein n=1 Tax=Pseudarthrobacter cellobiosi TaxID=2953654 RepID=UPI00208FCFF6|nr:polysaccharide deacetylase family protein [Pseudarthrobacter sp. HLT1-5]MCO4257416.1 polysaccharide deacetylase family protein [Pseudarthrobacter sp. HLT1-5]
MTFTFAAAVAWDPIGKQAVKNTSFQVYATADTGFVTPLAITDTFGASLPGNILNSGSQGVFPEFEQVAESTVVITDPSHAYVWTITAIMQDTSVAAFVGKSGSASEVAVKAAAKSAVSSELDNPASPIATKLSATYAAAVTPLVPTRYTKPPLEDVTVLLNPSAGHGWTLMNGATTGTTTEDTTRRGPFSDRSIKISRTTENTELVKSTGLAVNLNNGPLTVWVYLPDPNPKGVAIQAGDGGANFYQWDRYGNDGLGSDSPHVDGWTAFELYVSDAAVVGIPTPGNITTIRVRATVDNTTVWVGGIVQRTNPALYPNGVCTVYFDDGYDSIYNLGMPILAKHGVSAVLATICDAVDQPTWVTTAQLRELQDRCGWEIAAHAYTLTSHGNRYHVLTPAQLETEFRNLKAWLVSRGFKTDVWISPGGTSNTTIWEACRKYFSIHRSVSAGGANSARFGARWTSPRPMYPANIMSPNFSTTTTTKADMLATLDAIKANKSWGSLTFHQVITGPSTGQQISVADLDEIIAYANTIGVPIRTVNRVLKDVN